MSSYVCFKKGERFFGVKSSEVMEFVRDYSLSPVPFISSVIKGISTYKGKIIKVMALEDEERRGICLLILRCQEHLMGFETDIIPFIVEFRGEGLDGQVHEDDFVVEKVFDYQGEMILIIDLAESLKLYQRRIDNLLK